jgi:hypothetical protein
MSVRLQWVEMRIDTFSAPLPLFPHNQTFAIAARLPLKGLADVGRLLLGEIGSMPTGP